MLTQGFIQGTPRGTGINEDFSKGIDARVFPNPAKSQVTVSCKKAPISIEIIDLQGCKLYTKQNPQQMETLDVEHLQKGIYLLRILFEGNIPITKRIIKN
jgi:hypothetical protein